MIIDFNVVESASNPSGVGVGVECSIQVPDGSFVPRVGETCYLPFGAGAGAPFVVQKVSTQWVHSSIGYFARVRVDLRY